MSLNLLGGVLLGILLRTAVLHMELLLARKAVRKARRKALAWLHKTAPTLVALGLPVAAGILTCVAAEPTIRLAAWCVLALSGHYPGPYTAWAPVP